VQLHEASYFATVDPSYATSVSSCPFPCSILVQSGQLVLILTWLARVVQLLTSLLSENSLAPKLKTAAQTIQKSIGVGACEPS
jgi:hypothetical protein